MKNFICSQILPFLLFVHLQLPSQNAYRFETATSPYTELNGAQKIPFYQLAQLNGFYRLTELEGETFKWYNTIFTIDTIKTIHIQDYANFRFDNDSSLIIFDGAFTYLDSIDPNSSISYTIEGQSGDKIVKAQWKNLKVRVGAAGNFVNLQLWVYQKSGIMEIHYGQSSSNNGSGFNVNSGPQVGIFHSLDDFTQCLGKLWVNGSPSSPKLDSANNYTFKAMSGIPAEGTIYRFIPRFKTLDLSLSLKNEPFFIYPNPVSGNRIFVRTPGYYRLFDAHSRVIMQGHAEEFIDVGDLEPGIYFLSNKIKTECLIVE